ncbi:kinase-like domain-containing protein [Scleroderma citrinum]
MTDPTLVLEELSNRATEYCINFNGLIDLPRLATYGGFAAVYQATLRTTGSQVAVKTVQRPGNVKIIKKVLREAHVWSKLDHENVLRLIGMTTDFESSLSLVSKWMATGNAHDYVQDKTVDPRPLAVDIARGLCYLHNHPKGSITHGDLKGANVLISDEGHALLSDFGFTHMELFTREVPFSSLVPWAAVALEILKAPPDRPSDDLTHYRMTHDWWAICSNCWASDPQLRPSMSHLLNTIEDIKVIKDLTLGLSMLSKKANLFDINPDGQVTRNLDVTITGNGGNVIINILVSHEGRALITFNPTSLVDPLFRVPETPCGHPINWVAPEGLESGGFTKTSQGDVWTFGMTAIGAFYPKITVPRY